jgi:hypothetical protein
MKADARHESANRLGRRSRVEGDRRIVIASSGEVIFLDASVDQTEAD